MSEQDRPPSPGETFEGFHIEKYIGRGAAGLVFAATVPAESRRVALKWYDPNLRPRESASHLGARRLREAEVGTRIVHPNLVRTYSVGRRGGDEVPRYLVMEYLEGRTLDQALQPAESPLSIDELLGILRQLVDGVSALHAVGIVHRDIKPTNVMLCEDGRVVLLDFGVARHDDATTITGSKSFLGTLAYSAPEWLFGEECTAASDVYAIGAVLFFLLEGRGPFEQHQPYARQVKAIEQEAASLSVVATDTKEAFARSLVLRLLDKRADERPTLDQVREYLRAEATSGLWKQLRTDRITSWFERLEPGKRRTLVEQLSPMAVVDEALAKQDRDLLLRALGKERLEVEALKIVAGFDSPAVTWFLEQHLPPLASTTALSVLDHLHRDHDPLPLLRMLADKHAAATDVERRLEIAESLATEEARRDEVTAAAKLPVRDRAQTLLRLGAFRAIDTELKRLRGNVSSLQHTVNENDEAQFEALTGHRDPWGYEATYAQGAEEDLEAAQEEYRAFCSELSAPAVREKFRRAGVDPDF